MSLTRLGVTAVALLVLGGCLGPRTDLTRYFLLAPTAAPDASASQPPVGLGPVTLPDYLDQTRIATPRGNLEMGFLTDARWAERLGPMLRRSLAASLAERTGRLVVPYPWRPDHAPAVSAIIAITRFDVGPQSATLQAEWELRQGPALLRGKAAIEEPTRDTTVAERVAALNRTVSRLSDQLAAALR